MNSISVFVQQTTLFFDLDQIIIILSRYWTLKMSFLYISDILWIVTHFQSAFFIIIIIFINIQVHCFFPPDNYILLHHWSPGPDPKFSKE